MNLYIGTLILKAGRARPLTIEKYFLADELMEAFDQIRTYFYSELEKSPRIIEMRNLQMIQIEMSAFFVASGYYAFPEREDMMTG